MRRIVKILKKQARLHKKIDKLDAKFRRVAKRCDYRSVIKRGNAAVFSGMCKHPEQIYGVCDRMACPYRGDMFLSPPA